MYPKRVCSRCKMPTASACAWTNLLIFYTHIRTHRYIHVHTITHTRAHNHTQDSHQHALSLQEAALHPTAVPPLLPSPSPQAAAGTHSSTHRDQAAIGAVACMLPTSPYHTSSSPSHPFGFNPLQQHTPQSSVQPSHTQPLHARHTAITHTTPSLSPRPASAGGGGGGGGVPRSLPSVHLIDGAAAAASSSAEQEHWLQQAVGYYDAVADAMAATNGRSSPSPPPSHPPTLPQQSHWPSSPPICVREHAADLKASPKKSPPLAAFAPKSVLSGGELAGPDFSLARDQNYC